MTDASTTINIEQKMVRLKVDISKLGQIWSDEEMVQGVPWKIRIQKEIQTEEYLKIHLYCSKRNIPPNWSHAASAIIKLVSFNSSENAIERHIDPFIVNDTNNHDYTSISWRKVVDKSSNYVKDDMIMLDIKIEAEIADQIKRSSIDLVNIEKCCDESAEGLFRITIKNIENLIIVRSPTFKLRGINLHVEISKDCSNNVQFTLESTEREFACDMNMCLKLISSVAENSIEESKSDRFTYYDIMAIYSLLTWEDLLKPENGYVVNGSITMEMKVNTENAISTAQKRRAANGSSENKHAKLECPVCSQAISNQNVSFTPCGHLFCSRCIATSLIKRKICPFPLCNKEVTMENVKPAFLPIAKEN